MKKSLLPIFVVVIGIILFFIFRPQKAVGPMNNTNNQTDQNQSSVGDETSAKLAFPGILPDTQIKNKKAIIDTDKGTIVIELYADKAPKTVSNFVYLVDNAFYDGLTFHRVVPGFVIQGGDPKGDGTGGPGYNFDDEPVQGEYIKGSVAMANSGPNTNGSQFFICLEDQFSLPKSYNLFGQVISGIEVISQINEKDQIRSIIIEPMS